VENFGSGGTGHGGGPIRAPSIDDDNLGTLRERPDVRHRAAHEAGLVAHGDDDGERIRRGTPAAVELHFF
jgi:hypothetical protein